MAIRGGRVCLIQGQGIGVDSSMQLLLIPEPSFRIDVGVCNSFFLFLIVVVQFIAFYYFNSTLDLKREDIFRYNTFTKASIEKYSTICVSNVEWTLSSTEISHLLLLI